MDSKGYVYVVTSRSFPPDWVKIGFTQKPSVKERIKDLNCTSLPYPFEERAFLRCPDAPLAEAAAHGIMDAIAPDARLNPKREFFRIAPDSAAEMLRMLSTVIPGSAFTDHSQELEETAASAGTLSSVSLSLCAGGTSALGRIREDGSFLVLMGSKVAPMKESFAKHNPGYHQRRLELESEGAISDGEFGRDVAFPSASAAASVAYGGSLNGLAVWKSGGKTLGEILAEAQGENAEPQPPVTSS